jgi:hypothetical protein
MNADWLIGVAAFLPIAALIMPPCAIVPAYVIGFGCGIAWVVCNWREI